MTTATRQSAVCLIFESSLSPLVTSFSTCDVLSLYASVPSSISWDNNDRGLLGELVEVIHLKYLKNSAWYIVCAQEMLLFLIVQEMRLFIQLLLGARVVLGL